MSAASATSQLHDRIIKINRIEHESNKGPRIVVEDTAGNEFSTFDIEQHKDLINNKRDYVGKTFHIKFYVAKGRFLNLAHFVGPTDADPETDEIDPEDYVTSTEQLGVRNRQITRQSAGHDAARIVQGMIANGQFDTAKSTGGKGKQREEIRNEIEYWTEYFKQHHRTGEWPSGDNQ